MSSSAHRIAPLLTFLLLWLSAPTGAAQSTNDGAESDRWYQIDLVIFADRSSDAGAQEHWPRDIELRYPERVVRLKTPEAYRADNCDAPGIAAACPADENAPLPFVRVAQAEPEMREVIGRIGRSSRYRPLITASWTQQLQDRDSAPHMLIRGGEQFGRHFELEGHLKISLERYLHLNTDLWLTRYEQRGPDMRPVFDNVEWEADAPLQEEQHWPRIPLPPENRETDSTAQTAGIEPAQPSTRPEQRDGGAGMASASGAMAEDDQSTVQPAYDINAFLEETGGYAVERVVAMRQHRRMRSDQLHYIDHPLFGMLVKITRIGRPSEQDSADKTGDNANPD